MQTTSATHLFIDRTEQQRLKNLAQDVLAQAKALGASDAELGFSLEQGYSVDVRLGDVETIEYHRGKGLSLTVYHGQRKGSASTTDMSPQAVKHTVQAAYNLARFANEDPYAGLATEDLFNNNYPQLDLYFPWHIEPEQAIEIAKTCESTARAYDQRITNSDGANVSTHQFYRIYANSRGFIGSYPSSRHSLSCCLIAEKNGDMQRDYSYTVARNPGDLRTTQVIALEAAERTIKRLSPRRLKTCKASVLFRADIANGLFGHFISAIRGVNLYRKSSFLLDSLNKSVFPQHLHLQERPHLLTGLSSAPFDGDGLLTYDKDLVRDGKLTSYILSVYSARKLNMQSTANAGGVRNVCVNSSDYDLTALLREMQRGLFVTEVMGQGVNILTGNYSRGAAGFWVENGEIQYPVAEVTIAGNLKDMFANLALVGNDVYTYGSVHTGSVLIPEMTIGGE